MDHRFQVFVSSTYSDLKEERTKVAQAIIETDCFPAGMESFPASDDEQFEYIKKIIDQSDYYVLVIGGRYGSTGSDGISYTEKEFDYAVQKGIPILVFPHERPEEIAIDKRDLESDLVDKLHKFRSKALTGRLAKMWIEADGLAAQVMRSLLKITRDHPGVGWLRVSSQQIKSIQSNLDAASRKNRELETEIERLQKVISTPASDLSSGDEEVSLEFVYQWRDSRGRSIDGRDIATVTWNQILRTIGPDLLDWRHEGTVSHDVAQFLGPLKNRGNGTRLSQEALRTLRIQFLALGLIERRRLETVSKSVGDFWRLTDVGQHQVFKLRPIRKSPHLVRSSPV